jgi:hypothetical protein
MSPIIIAVGAVCATPPVAALSHLIHQVVTAPLVDAIGHPICPVNEDELEHRAGHRDHEQPGGVL